MGKLTFKTLIAFLFLQIFTVFFAQSAWAAEGFYWSNKNYGRGVGTIPPGTCAAGQEEDGGLCYESCRSGYYGVGPVCWERNLSQTDYGRGAGTVPHLKWDKARAKYESSCSDGKHEQSGLCYDDCRSGYSGKGPLCVSSTRLSYGRGAGKAETFACPSNKEKDAGLCYDMCREGYAGVGPVCWGKPPSGYVFCGMGFAVSDAYCGGVTTSQVASVGFLAGDYAGLVYASDVDKWPKWTKFLKGKNIDTAAGVASYVAKHIPALIKASSVIKKRYESELKELTDGKKSPNEAMASFANMDFQDLATIVNAMQTPKGQNSGGKSAQGLDALRDISGFISIIPGAVMTPFVLQVMPEAGPTAPLIASSIGDFFWVLSAYVYPMAP